MSVNYLEQGVSLKTCEIAGITCEVIDNIIVAHNIVSTHTVTNLESLDDYTACLLNASYNTIKYHTILGSSRL